MRKNRIPARLDGRAAARPADRRAEGNLADELLCRKACRPSAGQRPVYQTGDVARLEARRHAGGVGRSTAPSARWPDALTELDAAAGARQSSFQDRQPADGHRPRRRAAILSIRLMGAAGASIERRKADRDGPRKGFAAARAPGRAPRPAAQADAGGAVRGALPDRGGDDRNARPRSRPSYGLCGMVGDARHQAFATARRRIERFDCNREAA
jgi:hypothetical protein